MENNEFKRLLNKIACSQGFKTAFGGWFKESKDCIMVLELQKSNFGNYYYLNIKIFVNGLFNESYQVNKDLITKNVSPILSGVPKDYEFIFNLESQLKATERAQQLEGMFHNFMVPFAEKALNLKKIMELVQDGCLYIPQDIVKELEVLQMNN